MGGFKYPEGSLVVAVDADSFESFIKAHDRVFIHVGASWNLHDINLIPSIENFARTLLSTVSFAYMDCDLEENFALLRAHKMYNIPYFEYYEFAEIRAALTGCGAEKKILNPLIDEFGKP